MKSRKNLTRFTYETTAFQGWRLNIYKRGTTFEKYFSDKKYGGQRKALKAADTARTELIEQRKPIMELWANFVTGTETENVIEFRHG